MKYLKKCLVMIILMTLFIAYPKVEAINNMIVKQDSNKITSVKTVDVTSTIINEKEKEAEDKPKCQYKEGEVIITYEQSFWNSKTKLSLDSVINKYIVDETLEFDEIKIDSDNTVSISDDDSNESTLAISKVKSDKHTTKELIDLFKGKDWIISVEPNYIIKLESLTNDTYEKYQWGLENTGQNSGTKELDINPISTSSDKEKVIAIIDSGVDYTHEDLKNIMWTNPYSENKLKGTYGYNFVANNNDIMDDMYHGTHVAGIIAAEANNKIGISGTTLGACNVKIMALKVTDGAGAIGDIYSIIEAYNYIYKAQQLGTNIVAINNSWGGYLQFEDDKAYMNSLLSVISLVGEKGALSICAAGNESNDLGKDGLKNLDLETVDENGETILDEFGNPVTKNVLCKSFPGCLDSEYIINVAASDEKDELATFSNYGEAVDIAAPGTNILSTIPNKIYGSANAGFDTRMFLPSIYDADKRAKVCEQYWDFENNTIDDIPFTVNIGTLSIVDNKSFGRGKRSLKWEFTLDGNQETYPELKLGNNYTNNDFFSCMISADVEGDDAFIITGCKWKDEDGEEWITEHGSGVFSGNSNYWSKFGNPVWELSENESMNEIYVQVRNLIACQNGYYTIYIDDFGVSKPCEDEDVRVPYTFLYGTSMAAPFVTGAVGTMSNLYENETALQLKDRILSCTRKNQSLEGKVATGGVLDLTNAIIKPTGISLDKSNENMSVGDELQLTATITPENATNKNVKWKSSNSKIATVENGKVKAIAEGTATITATTEEGNLEAKCVITVNKKQLINISDCKIEGIVPTYHTGEKVKLNLAVYNGNNKLTENIDYKVSYKNNTNVGDATVTISGIGNYTGKISKNFKIINRPNISAKIDHYITSAFSRGRALDLKNGATNAGNNIQLKTLSCGKTQKYKIIKNKKDESFYIQNVESKKYLGVNDKNTGKAKTKVVLADNNTTPGTKWYIGQNSDASISFYTKDGLVIEALENNNTNLQINVSNNSSLQKFITTRTDYISAASISTTKVYYIVSSINNKKAIDVYAAGTADYTNVDIYDLNKTNAQKFKFQKNSDGSYTIINKGSNKAIDVFENKTANMTNIDIYTKNNTTAQKWYAIKNLDGTITFLGAESGKALDLYAADTNNFGNINIWDWNQTNAQKWKLIN